MRGGKRDGAGRKPGIANKRTRELAERAHLEGITPLEVMLRTMRLAWDEAEKPGAAPAQAIAMRMAAVETANKAAPYVHPRLAQVEQKTDMTVTQGVVSGDPLPPDEWEKAYGGTH